MFQIDEYKVEFSHFSDYSVSTCVITKDKKQVVKTATWCHPNDQFNRNTGRKVALRMALIAFTEDRELRKRFWDAYFAARNGKH